MLCSLLRRELHRKGIDRSIPDILDELAKIREVGIVYPLEGKQNAQNSNDSFSDVRRIVQAFRGAKPPRILQLGLCRSYKNGDNSLIKSMSYPKRA